MKTTKENLHINIVQSILNKNFKERAIIHWFNGIGKHLKVLLSLRCWPI